MNTMLGPGLHFDVSDGFYHSDPCENPSLSASIAAILASDSPLHAWYHHPRLGGNSQTREPSKAQERGSILHEIILGTGGGFQEIQADDFRKKFAQEARDAARANGIIPVLSADLAEYRQIASTVQDRIADMDISLSGQSEVTAIWESDGVLCRARMDHLILSDGIIYDLKSATPSLMRRLDLKMVDNGSDVQSFAYTEAIETLYPDLAGRVRMRFIFFEVEPPYDVVIGEPSSTMRARGELLWTRAKIDWRKCLETNTWPGRGRSNIVRIDCPPWALDQAMKGEESYAG